MDLGWTLLSVLDMKQVRPGSCVLGCSDRPLSLGRPGLDNALGRF
jgi:hypothetical protein